MATMRAAWLCGAILSAAACGGGTGDGTHLDGGHCMPACSGRVCGPDSCGSSCGTCAAGQACASSGTCVATSCTPNCTGRVCGDDGCGGTCGTCATGQSCTAGTCSGCMPNCSGRTCGTDGCSGTCAPGCTGGATCNATGTCTGGCVPACGGRVCGGDGCGGMCPPGCPSGATCTSAGRCTCVPSCSGRVCGPDGCGGTCGAGCAAGHTCSLDGTMCLLPTCTDCTSCAATEACIGGVCQSPWGMTYRITFLSGVFPEHRTDGSSWNVGGGLPDPVIAANADSAGWHYSCVDDTTTPTWDQYTDVTLNSSSELDFEILDGDGLGCSMYTTDPICSFYWGSATSPSVRDLICAGGFNGSLDALTGCTGMSASFTVTPM